MSHSRLLCAFRPNLWGNLFVLGLMVFANSAWAQGEDDTHLYVNSLKLTQNWAANKTDSDTFFITGQINPRLIVEGTQLGVGLNGTVVGRLLTLDATGHDRLIDNKLHINAFLDSRTGRYAFAATGLNLRDFTGFSETTGVTPATLDLELGFFIGNFPVSLLSIPAIMPTATVSNKTTRAIYLFRSHHTGLDVFQSLRTTAIEQGAGFALDFKGVMALQASLPNNDLEFRDPIIPNNDITITLSNTIAISNILIFSSITNVTTTITNIDTTIVTNNFTNVVDVVTTNNAFVPNKVITVPLEALSTNAISVSLKPGTVPDLTKLIIVNSRRTFELATAPLSGIDIPRASAASNAPTSYHLPLTLDIPLSIPIHLVLTNFALTNITDCLPNLVGGTNFLSNCQLDSGGTNNCITNLDGFVTNGVNCVTNYFFFGTNFTGCVEDASHATNFLVNCVADSNGTNNCTTNLVGVVTNCVTNIFGYFSTNLTACVPIIVGGSNFLSNCTLDAGGTNNCTTNFVAFSTNGFNCVTNFIPRIDTVQSNIFINITNTFSTIIELKRPTGNSAKWAR